MDELTEKLQQWKVTEVPAGLEERLWREITALPQQRSWVHRFQKMIERSFADWNYGLIYKVTGLACCAMLGFYLGAQQAPQLISAPKQASLQITDLALARGNWMEDL